MNKYNPKNERIKRDYFRYQREASHKSDGTLNSLVKAIDRFEEHTNYKDFNTFNKEQAISFKKHFAIQKAKRTGELISKSTILSTINVLKEFFRWIAFQPGYKSCIHVPNIEYFNLTDKEISVAKYIRHKSFPTLEQIRKVVFSMPSESDIQRRNRALIAFTILTGMRDNAIASLRIKHIDLTREPILVRQEPDLVRTKFSKQILTYFFPVGDDFKSVVVDWLKELREIKNYGMIDPVFPRTYLDHDENMSFAPNGLKNVCWNTTSPIRKIFKEAFESAGIPYFHPHLFRHTLTHIGQERCTTPEQFKAWSQNFGHETPLTTFTSYGNIDPYRQGDIIKNIQSTKNSENKIDLILELLKTK